MNEGLRDREELGILGKLEFCSLANEGVD